MYVGITENVKHEPIIPYLVFPLIHQITFGGTINRLVDSILFV